MKVVIDTNILINVLLSPIVSSASFKIIECCLNGEIEPQISSGLYSELRDVSSREFVIENSVYSFEEISEILNGFLSISNWVNISFLWCPNLKDEADNHLVELAVASGAEYVVSYNIRDLTSGDLLFDWQAITPEKFLNEVIK